MDWMTALPFCRQLGGCDKETRVKHSVLYLGAHACFKQLIVPSMPRLIMTGTFLPLPHPVKISPRLTSPCVAPFSLPVPAFLALLPSHPPLSLYNHTHTTAGGPSPPRAGRLREGALSDYTGEQRRFIHVITDSAPRSTK